jgi:hypothetical protein
MLYGHCLFNLPFIVYIVINEQNTDQQNLTPLHPYIPAVLWYRGSSQERDHHGSVTKFVLTLLSVKNLYDKRYVLFSVSERPLSSVVAATACLVTGKHNNILFRASTHLNTLVIIVYQFLQLCVWLCSVYVNFALIMRPDFILGDFFALCYFYCPINTTV